MKENESYYKHTGLAKVLKITKKIVVFGKWTIPMSVATLAINNEEVDVVVHTEYPNPNHRYTWDNVVPHKDWIREGMEVDLCADWDGYYIRQDISRYSKKPYKLIING